ncbi:MAG: hypothetical protein ACXABV_16885 [Candidatus Thorarchaeota archaeon]|jgi:hypothetical protein
MTGMRLHSSDGYVKPSVPSKGLGCRTILVAGVLVTIVIVGGLIGVTLPGPGGDSHTPTTLIPNYPYTPTYPYTRKPITVLTDVDVDISPDYSAEEFSVSSSEVQTSIPPALHFFIVISNVSSDTAIDESIEIHIAVYDSNLSTVEDAPTWDDLSPYLIGEATLSEPVSMEIDLRNSPSTYTWVIWFEAPYKTDVWEVTIWLFLRYNWT